MLSPKVGVRTEVCYLRFKAAAVLNFDVFLDSVQWCVGLAIDSLKDEKQEWPEIRIVYRYSMFQLIIRCLVG